MADKKGTSSSSTPAPYIPPHLRSSSHFRTSEKTADLHQFPRSMYRSRKNVTDRSQDAPWNLNQHLRPKFSMTCFDVGHDAVFPPSCNEAIRLQIVPSCQETWSPEEYLRPDRREALYFYLSGAPMSTLGQTSERTSPSSEIMESSALSPRPTSSSRVGFAGDWRRSTYEEILEKGLVELADTNSTARCLPCRQDVTRLEPARERVKICTKVYKCFFKVSSKFFPKALQCESLLDNVEVADLRTFSISELGNSTTSRHLSHQAVARATSARNISNGRNYLLMSSMYEDIPQRSCKIVIICSDRDNPGHRYDITIVYEADATATFPEREPDLQGKCSEQSSCNEADRQTLNQKLYPTWREASNARLLSIIVKRSPRRHCFINFLRPGKGSDIRLGMEKREVPQTEPCEPILQAWAKEAWEMRSDKGVLQFNPVSGFEVKCVRYKEYMETFKSKNFKVKMCKVTQTTSWDHVNMTSEWECLVQSLQVKEMCGKGFKPDEVAMMVPLVQQLVEETTKLTLAMGDVNSSIKRIHKEISCAMKLISVILLSQLCDQVIGDEIHEGR